jgi:hypothetical protein
LIDIVHRFIICICINFHGVPRAKVASLEIISAKKKKKAKIAQFDSSDWLGLATLQGLSVRSARHQYRKEGVFMTRWHRSANRSRASTVLPPKQKNPPLKHRFD